jgi:Putative peptidoglycan binding domain/N-acetylmuramoyl-L-alanine amidase
MTNRVWIPSPCYSSRGGSSVKLIVLHTSEGAQDIYSLGNFFANSANQVSSHTGADNHRQGTIAEYVSRGNKAWTQGNANPVCVSMELCTPSGAAAGWSRDYWLNKQGWMLHNAADWVREESAHYGIPLVSLTASQAQGGSRGVCDHVDLGSWGGGHSDCGSGFPMDKIIEWAGGSAPPPTTSPPPSGGKAPPFPYPSDHYLGQPSSDPCCHSGFYGGSDNTNVRTWQTQMRNRGWTISTDGMYGEQSYSVCQQFQSEKGLSADGLCGPQTWDKTWSAPIT